MAQGGILCGWIQGLRRKKPNERNQVITGYITVLRYMNPCISPRIRFWDTLEEARSYKSGLLLTYIKSIEVQGPVTINPAWVDADGLLTFPDYKSLNISPPPNELSQNM